MVTRLIECRNWLRFASAPSWENPVRLPVSWPHEANRTEIARWSAGSARTTGPSMVRSTVRFTGGWPATSIVSGMACIATCWPLNSYVGGVAAKLTLCSMPSRYVTLIDVLALASWLMSCERKIVPQYSSPEFCW